MKLKDHYAALRAIHAELAAIAEQTKTMAHANLADPSNTDWLYIMDRQDALLGQLSRLDNQPLEL
ncbi:hypothetical protein [Massilia sp. LjRoot122]|uniref:hypothetical protein n=1 Tax=Massilia sp. LjRoot122 TaxID=3342257 RepID=UPI003ECCE80D